jgi:tRNA (guanine37-N1)-methyltransferase
MRIEVLTLFPLLVQAAAEYGIPRRAIEAGRLEVATRDIRDHAVRPNRRVDDRPYGGGPGMVMEAEPLMLAIDAARSVAPAARVLAMSPQGEPLTQAVLHRLASGGDLIMVCGRYEGIDERLAVQMDESISIGDFVLSGGELAAMVLIDGISRLLPGVLGDERSAESDSFSAGLLDHPHYTRPELWRGKAVPPVLIGGNHAAVDRWRMKQALGRTWWYRPDLLDGIELSVEQTRLLREFISENGIVGTGDTED